MGQKPLLVAETIGWYQWRERIKEVNDLYKRRMAILCGQRYNYRYIMCGITNHNLLYFMERMFIKNIITCEFKAFIPKKYYLDQNKFDQMILDAANQRKYIHE